MKEEEVYLKALSILDESLDGRNVNPVALTTATNMMFAVWTSVHQERVKKEQIKDALREVWDEEIEEKINGKDK